MSRWWALAGIVLSVLAVGLDSYVLMTALPTLSADLHASTGGLQWITTSYLLANAGLMLLGGRLGDRFGHRRVLLAGLAVFGLASVAASQTTSTDGLIAARAVMGVGGAVIMPMSLALIPLLFPDPVRRGRATTVVTVGAMLGLPLGPVLAGWILGHLHWGWVFLINVPVVALGLLAVGLLVPADRPGERGPVGTGPAIVGAAAVTGLVYAVIQWPTDGWSGPVVACAAGGLLLLVAWAVWQLRSRRPLVDLRLLRVPAFGWGTLAFAVVTFALSGVLFLLGPYLQVVQGASAQGTGLRFLPMIGGLLVAAAVTGRPAARIGLKYAIPAGMLLSAAALACFPLIGAGTGYGPVALLLAVFGAGLGISLPLAADAVLAALPPERVGIGNALSRTVQAIGSALGAAVLGSALTAVYRAQLPAATPRAARAGVAEAHGLGLPGVSAAADHAYALGLGRAALIAAAVVAVTALAALRGLPRAAEAMPEIMGLTCENAAIQNSCDTA